MDIEYIKGFTEKYGFDAEAVDELYAAAKVISKTKVAAVIDEKVAEYEEKGDAFEFRKALGEVSETSETENVNKYAALLILVISYMPVLKKRYDEAGYTEEMFRGVALDIRCKCYECRKVKGCCGTFVADWYSGFFNLTILSFGRLEYQYSTVTPYDTDDGVNYTGLPGISIHIPSLGPLKKEDLDASFKMAAEFFKDKIDAPVLVFMCKSWLLYPAHNKYLPESSGIKLFQSYFKLVNSVPSQTGGDMWRVFDTEDWSDIEKLPEKTSLQLGYKELLRGGCKGGYGYGIKVVNK